MYRLLRPNANKEIVLDIRALLLLVAAIFATNFFTYRFFSGDTEHAMWGEAGEELYLLDKAGQHIEDTHTFAQKVRRVSADLAVPAEWLMAVMYAESRFNASVANHKGSGAVGLIQFMPATIKDYGTNINNLKEMSADRQLDYVYKYLDRVRNKYGAFDNLTDLYLAILYPRALEGDYCYTLYAKPSVSYKQNAGLDHDDDGRVTVRDIDKHLAKIYPTAYALNKDGTKGVDTDKKDKGVVTAGF